MKRIRSDSFWDDDDFHEKRWIIGRSQLNEVNNGFLGQKKIFDHLMKSFMYEHKAFQLNENHGYLNWHKLKNPKAHFVFQLCKPDLFSLAKLRGNSLKLSSADAILKINKSILINTSKVLGQILIGLIRNLSFQLKFSSN